MNENILVVAMMSCRFWLYMGPVVATFYLTNFLATDRLEIAEFASDDILPCAAIHHGKGVCGSASKALETQVVGSGCQIKSKS